MIAPATTTRQPVLESGLAAVMKVISKGCRSRLDRSGGLVPRLGIRVYNFSRCLRRGEYEVALGYMLMLEARDLELIDWRVRKGRSWPKPEGEGLMRVLGRLAMGAIGRGMRCGSHLFGMRIVGCR